MIRHQKCWGKFSLAIIFERMNSFPSDVQTPKSIAVLPFVNMSTNEENEFFSDGITEEIINALTRISGLRVTSRTSSFFFKNKTLPIKEIGSKLNVSLVLEGSVRLAPNMMRITAQLIEAEEDIHIWSETWDRPTNNIFEVQDEVSLLIAEKAREHLGHFDIQDQLVHPQTQSLDTYSWYLKGRYHFRKWNPQDARQAIECYDHALHQDPNHAESIIGKADAISFLATTGNLPQEEYMPRYGEMIQQALELNENLPEAHYQLSQLNFFIYGNFEAAHLAARKAFELNQNYSEANQQLAFLYMCANQLDKARPYIERSSQIDPFSQEALFFKAYFLYRQERFEDALDVLNQSLAENPLNIPAHSVKAYCLLKSGRYDEALVYFDQIPQEIVVEEDRLGVETMALIYLKRTQEAAEKIQEISARAKTPEGFRANSFLLFIYGIQNDKEQAIAWMQREQEHGSSFLMLHVGDPLMGEMRKDPEYQALVSEIFTLTTIPEQRPEKKSPIAEEDHAPLLETLYRKLEQEHLYLDPTLSLKGLAAEMDLHPNHLSWLINEKTGRNFNQLLNSYRVKAFQQKALDPEYAHLSMLGIAFESGFNSKTVFNTYFKKETGMTPKAWIGKSSES